MSFLKNLRQRRQELGSGSSEGGVFAAESELEDAERLDPLDKTEAHRIVSAYGQALVFSSALEEGDAENESLLPYPKNLIKKAIELLLRDDTDPRRIDLLRAGLMYLDDFH